MRLPRASPKFKKLLLVPGLLLLVIVIWFWGPDLLLRFRSDPSTSTLLVLEDTDEDFRIPPFEDRVTVFRAGRKSVPLITNLNICQTVGGNRSFAMAPGGGFFLVCETVGRQLLAYESSTGKKLWALPQEYTAATASKDGIVYAVISSGTIYGKETVRIENGQITLTATNAGFDIVLDEPRQVLWLVGANLQKCDLNLNLVLEVDPIKWCAVSCDVSGDGALWVAEREHPNVALSSNRVLKVSTGGQILQTINLPWTPCCVRVDRSDDSLWVTGFENRESATARWLKSLDTRFGKVRIGKSVREFLARPRTRPTTWKLDREGNILHRLSEGGYTIDIDPTDKSLWIIGKDRVVHYSASGKKLSQQKGLAKAQRWGAVLPQQTR